MEKLITMSQNKQIQDLSDYFLKRIDEISGKEISENIDYLRPLTQLRMAVSTFLFQITSDCTDIFSTEQEEMEDDTVNADAIQEQYANMIEILNSIQSDLDSIRIGDKTLKDLEAEETEDTELINEIKDKIIN